MTVWQQPCFSWPSVVARWLSHTTWYPKTRRPRPPKTIQKGTNSPHPSPVKVLKHDVGFLPHILTKMIVYHNAFLSMIDISALCLSAKVKQFLKDSLSSQNSAITLAHIASLERKLTKNFKLKDFLSLGQGNFLEFLVKNTQVQVVFSSFYFAANCLFLCFYGF